LKKATDLRKANPGSQGRWHMVRGHLNCQTGSNREAPEAAAPGSMGPGVKAVGFMGVREVEEAEF